MANEHSADQATLEPGAEGITIYAGDSATPPDSRRVRWVRQSDGSVVAEEYAYDRGSGEGGALQVRAEGGTNPITQVIAQADQTTVSPTATLMNNAHDVVSQVTVEVVDGGGSSADKLILNSNGESDFLQMGSTGIKAVDVGSGTVTFAASSVNTVRIAHSLRVPPDQVILTLNSGTNSGIFLYWIGDSTAPQSFFQVHAVATANLSGTFTFNYAAFGVPNIGGL